MSLEAKHIKKGNYIFIDNEIYDVLSTDEYTSHGNHEVKLCVQNFETNHKKTLHFGLKHHIVLAEPETVTYDAIGLGELTNGQQYLLLMNKHSGENELNLYVDNPELITYLQNHFKDDPDKFLTVHFRSFQIDKMHRNESNKFSQKITGVEGFDMKHLHDKHHNHHHH